MNQNVGQDQLVIIRINGMHCHKCEQTVQNALKRLPGVHEVEVDFNSRQASVLFDRNAVTVRQLMTSVEEAGYQTAGFVQRQGE